MELNRHEARKLIIKELDIRANGGASKSTIEDMKVMERARIKRRKCKVKYSSLKSDTADTDGKLH